MCDGARTLPCVFLNVFNARSLKSIQLLRIYFLNNNMVNGKNVIMIPNELSSVVISKIFSLHFLISAEHRTKKKFNLERPVTRFFTQTVCRRNKSFISKNLILKNKDTQNVTCLSFYGQILKNVTFTTRRQQETSVFSHIYNI